MYVKNIDSVNHFYNGQLVLPGTYEPVPVFSRLQWANNKPLIKDLTNNLALMARDNSGSADILDFNTGINFLKEIPTPTLPDYTGMLYEEVASESESLSPGVVIPDGQNVGVLRFKGNGQDPNAYVMLVYDRGGGSEKIFGVIKSEEDSLFDISLPYAKITGNGVSKLQLILVNNSTQSAAIGGIFEAKILV